ncbi:MAG: peptidylprolyl isomerase, partial [Bacteroidota bacterium]
AYKSENDKIAIKYVQIPYTSIPDSTITIAESEIKAYAKDHEKDFKKEPLRAIQYVYFEEKASLEDEKEVKTQITDLLEDRIAYNANTNSNDTIVSFKAIKDVEDFISRNSDIPFDSTFVAKKDLPAAFADSLFYLNNGDVYGPYKDGNYFKISRMMAKKPEGSVRTSHILIAYKGAQRALPTVTRSKEEAEVRAKVILKDVLSNPESFAQMARDNSDGPTASRGGDLGYFKEGDMVKDFNDFAFNNPVGTIDIVETAFGFHVIKIEDKEDLIQIATIGREIAPSEETINTLFKDATTFEIAVSEKDFAETARAESYSVRPVRNLNALDENIAGIGNQRSIVQWAFNKETSTGDIRRFNVNGGYAIVQLTSKTKQGTIAREDINTKIRPILLKQKKAEAIIAQHSGKTLQELADENKLPVRTASELTMKKLTISGVGREPKIIGVAFALDEGQTSGLVKGENGVYLVEVTKKEKAKPLDNYLTYANTQKTTHRGRASAAVYNALKEASKIVDNRADFY